MSTDSERDQSTDRLLKAALRPGDAPRSDACLDAETLAAWADGELYGQDAVGIEAHLADCARCQAMMAALAQSEPPTLGRAPAVAPAVIPFRPRRTLRWFVPVAAGTVAATLLIWTAVRSRVVIRPPVESVAKIEPAAPPQIQTAPAENVPGVSRPRAETGPAKPRARQAVPLTETLAPARPATSPPAAAPKPAPAAAPVAPPPAASPVTAPRPAPPPTGAAAGATGATAAQVAAGADLVRAQTPVVSQISSANVTQTLPRSDRNALGFLVFLPQGGIEFGPPDLAGAAGAGGAGGAAGGGGRGGGGGGGSGRIAALKSAASSGVVRWRIAPNGDVTKTTDGGSTWNRVALDPPAAITSGAAPSASVCWLIGRSGLVLLTIDGTKFTRIAFPEATDLQSVTALDGSRASVTTVGGRLYTTTDGGTTWK